MAGKPRMNIMNASPIQPRTGCRACQGEGSLEVEEADLRDEDCIEGVKCRLRLQIEAAPFPPQ